jgi:hypothetical protein
MTHKEVIDLLNQQCGSHLNKLLSARNFLEVECIVSDIRFDMYNLRDRGIQRIIASANKSLDSFEHEFDKREQLARDTWHIVKEHIKGIIPERLKNCRLYREFEKEETYAKVGI